MRFRIQTLKSIYIVDLEARTLSKNKKPIELEDHAVNIISQEQKKEVVTEENAMNLFNYQQAPPHINKGSQPYQIAYKQKNCPATQFSSKITSIKQVLN
ncbi:MAG: hypothetical protein AABX08_03755 [Nanoarchaeota archaeon]